MGDQVFIYKLTNANAWSVTTREASPKEIKAGTNEKIGVSWSGNVVTLSNTMTAEDMPMSSSDSTKVSASISSLANGIAILAEGDTHAAISTGAFVYVREHSTLAEGLYKNKSSSAIAENVALSSSNVTAISNGGLNALSYLDSIFSGNANNDDGTVTYNLTHPYTDYKFIIIIAKTNYEKQYQIVPTETIENWDNVHFFGGAASTTGLISS